MNSEASVGEYDLVILGSGEGGKFLAWTMATMGKRVLVVERKYIGGSCPNIACLPSKNVIHSAKVASYFFRSDEFGITKDNACIEMAAVTARKRLMVAGLVDMHLQKLPPAGRNCSSAPLTSSRRRPLRSHLPTAAPASCAATKSSLAPAHTQRCPEFRAWLNPIP